MESTTTHEEAQFLEPMATTYEMVAEREKPEDPEEECYWQYGWDGYLTRVANETIDEMLHSMVSFAEALPYNQNHKAEVIRSMLLENIVLGKISIDAVTPEMKQRICNLGKKEAPMQIASAEEVRMIEEAEVLAEAGVMPKLRKGGRKAEPLFCDKRGERDMELTQQKAADFMAYLSENALQDKHINTQQDNEVNKAFVCHYKAWMHDGLVPRMHNARACYRFLANECQLKFDVSEKSYAEFIRRQIS